MPNYFQPEIECASREELREIQSPAAAGDGEALL